MILISVNRKILKIVLASLLLAVLGLCLYGLLHAGRPHRINLMDQPESQDGVEASLEAVFMITSDNDSGNIELFDIGKGFVIGTIAPDPAILEEGRSLVQGVDGMYIRMRALPDKGYIVKIPYKSSLPVRNKWINDCGIKKLDKLFVLFPENGKPYLLVLDQSDRPHFFYFQGSTSKLLEDLGLELQK